MSISFSILVRSSQAILLFDFAKKHYPLLAVTETYYQSDTGETYVGADAGYAYDHDREAETLNEHIQSNSFVNYKSDFPVIFILKYHTFAASHPDASVSYQNFLDRNKAMW